MPTSLAINGDIGLRRDRLLSQDELIEYMARQIEAAAKLGFSIARVQISLTPDSMEALLPVAEQHGITLALEVHAHQHGRHELVMALRDRYDQLDSPAARLHRRLGRHRHRLRAVAARGLPPTRCHARSCSPPSPSSGTRPTARARPTPRRRTASASAPSSASPTSTADPTSASTSRINGTGLFGPAPIDTWREIAPWIKHCHGKFFGIDENGEEPSVPVRELIELLADIGYNGAISSEYEGWHWNYWESPFDIIRGEQAVQRSAAEAPAPAWSPTPRGPRAARRPPRARRRGLTPRRTA